MPALDGLETIELGRTMDARLGQRVIAVLRAAAHGGNWQDQLVGSAVFVARQLEMLAVASLARRRIAPRAPLVFECLDIHRLMLTRQPIGTTLRMLERHLLKSCSLLIVSSPAFLSNHFARYRPALPPQLLLENKVLAEDVPSGVLEQIAQRRAAGPVPGPPWRIGWFGVIRCSRSLQLLAESGPTSAGRGRGGNSRPSEAQHHCLTSTGSRQPPPVSVSSANTTATLNSPRSMATSILP